MNINRYDVLDPEGKSLGFIDAPNQGAAEKIYRQRNRAAKIKTETPVTFARKDAVATYDGGYDSWDVEQRAGKFD